MNEVNRQGLNAAQRLHEHFKLSPQVEENAPRGKVLGDGTKIYLFDPELTSPFKGHDQDSFRAQVHQADRKAPYYGFTFKVDARLGRLKEVGFAYPELKIDQTEVEVHNGPLEFKLRPSADPKGELATALTDWLDHIIEDDRYSPPPISVHIPTAGK